MITNKLHRKKNMMEFVNDESRVMKLAKGGVDYTRLSPEDAIEAIRIKFSDVEDFERRQMCMMISKGCLTPKLPIYPQYGDAIQEHFRNHVTKKPAGDGEDKHADNLFVTTLVPISGTQPPLSAYALQRPEGYALTEENFHEIDAVELMNRGYNYSRPSLTRGKSRKETELTPRDRLGSSSSQNQLSVTPSNKNPQLLMFPLRTPINQSNKKFQFYQYLNKTKKNKDALHKDSISNHSRRKHPPNTSDAPSDYLTLTTARPRPFDKLFSTTGFKTFSSKFGKDSAEKDASASDHGDNADVEL
jgi:hypothetical protein